MRQNHANINVSCETSGDYAAFRQRQKDRANVLANQFIDNTILSLNTKHPPPNTSGHALASIRRTTNVAN